MTAGLWFIDGIDLWQTYGVVIEEGSADFLKYPPRKPSTTRDWLDSNGIDVDLSRVFLNQREGILQCALLAKNNEDYFSKHDGFFNMLVQPGLRRLELTAHNNRSYFVYYDESPSYEQVSALKATVKDYPIVHRFSIKIVEPEPKLYPSNIFLQTETGAFIIT